MNLCPSSIFSGKGAPRLWYQGIFSGELPGRNAALKRNGERGAGHLKAIIWTMILVAFIYGAAMVLPVLINEYQFQDSLQSIARFASVNRKNVEQVRQAVLEAAQKDDFPVQAEDIKVEDHAGNVHIN